MSERAQSNAEIMAFVARKQPLAAGALQPDDLVGAALFLLSDDSRMVSGQVVTVDGGWSLRLAGRSRLAADLENVYCLGRATREEGDLASIQQTS